jgi:hypothetical protein
MSSAALARLIPDLAPRREQERQNRALAFAGITHTVCGREILPLTPGHRLNLQLVQNAFFTLGASATLQDVFVFLWVTSPANVGGVEAARQQYFLRHDVAAFDLGKCVEEISRYLLDQLQDAFDSGGGDGKDLSPWIHWMAMDAEFWISVHGGFTFEQYNRTPYLVLQQLYRAWKANNPDIERMHDGKVIVRDPVFFNSSDRLVSQFHRENKDRIKAWHLAQKNKRN